MSDPKIEDLKNQIRSKEIELDELRERLQILQAEALQKERLQKHLSNDDIARYSRQLILPEIGVAGQLKLKHASVLIVGAGGLGCPAALYLAAAGIGRLGIVDYDEVEINNLHRQILHQESKMGVSKVKSAASSIFRLNSKTVCSTYIIQLSSSNALNLIKKYDIIVDASDNVATRYLLNDACVLANRPLVSGSALRFEGQLTVYNYQHGPCYRCLFPQPPPANAVTNCSDGGVIGVVPGIIGCLQALEVIKIVSDLKVSYSQRMLLFDGLSGNFKVIKLRPRSPKCLVCGENPQITELIDYEQFCGAPAADKGTYLNILTKDQRLTCKEYKEILDSEKPHALIDVRPKVEMEICSLPHAVNIPIDDLDKVESEQQLSCLVKKYSGAEDYPVIVVCRRGNDSQLAVRNLQSKFYDIPIVFKDIKGGLHGWAQEVDRTFPVY